MTTSTAETITLLLEQIINSVHPLMAEALYLAAVPDWYDAELFAAMRQRDDGRNQGLIERLNRYSFITPLTGENGGQPTYTVRPDERMFLQRHWIRKDPEAYRLAHQRAYAYGEAHPVPNPFAQAQNQLYHLFFIDFEAANNELVRLFRAYRYDRQLVAIERLLDNTTETHFYLALLGGESLAQLDDLLTHLRALLAQMRGQWTASQKALQELGNKSDLSPRLRPYVARAYGTSLAKIGQYVQAIKQYENALELFDQQAGGEDGMSVHPADDLNVERAYTQINLGDTYVAFAKSARGYHEPLTQRPGLREILKNGFHVFLSLPLVLYLSLYLSGRVWYPRSWGSLGNLDWMIARLFVLGSEQYKEADNLLEQYGSPPERVAADEKLANLYLAADAVGLAEEYFRRLLAETDAPLGEYRRAAVQAGLGEALLRLDQRDEACEHLETAVPILELYEDTRTLAHVHTLLAECHSDDDLPGAIGHYAQALQLYLAQGDVVNATEICEQLEKLAQNPDLAESDRETAVQLANSVSERRYRARYRNPVTVFFQRSMLLLLALIAFIIPITIIRLETGSTVEPVISFNATPLLQPDDANFVPSLSQGVSALSLAPSPNPQVLLWAGGLLFLAYVIISTAIGFWLMIRTSLSQVQESGQADEVRLDKNNLRVGSGAARREVKLDEATYLVRGDVSFGNQLMIDNTTTGIITAEDQAEVRGNTAWYTSIYQHLEARSSPAASRKDMSIGFLRGRMGIIYIGTIAVLTILGVMGKLVSPIVTHDIPIIQYSLADIYPYFYLGMLIPMLWWFAIRPLQARWHINPSTRFIWWVGGLGLILALFRIITFFRPWLTVPDIYPSLTVMILAVLIGVAAWRRRQGGDGRWLILVVLLLTIIAFLVMGAHLVREVTAYHYLSIGNARREQTLTLTDSKEKDERLFEAINAYSQAIQISQIPILGITGADGGLMPFGIPRSHEFTWLAALNSRAAMFAQLGMYPQAIKDYDLLLKFTNKQAETYASRAIAYQGWGTEPGTEAGTVDVSWGRYNQAIADFDKAIELDSQNASYRLWRGVAYHALNNLKEAMRDYDESLNIGGSKALNSEGQAQALTGQGWILYSQGEYKKATERFERANEAAIEAESSQASSDALVGAGYAYYAQREYEAALEAWSGAVDTSVDNPLIYTSLGTLHWRVATLGDDYEAGGSNRCANDNLSEAEKKIEAEHLEDSISNFTQAAQIPGQEDEDVAYTYRTQAQVQFLLSSCFDKDEEVVDVLEDAVDSYSQAIELDPENDQYYYRRGRLAHAIWDRPGSDDEWIFQAIDNMAQAAQLAPETAEYWHDRAWMQYLIWDNAPDDAGPTAREWLFSGLEDLEEALILNPNDQGGYRPNWWLGIMEREAVDGTLRKGDENFAEGDYKLAQQYYTLVAENVPDHADAAFKVGLAATANEDEVTAVQWYDEGINRAQTTGDTTAVQEALFDLTILGDEELAPAVQQSLETLTDSYQRGPFTPEDAESAFNLALGAITQNDLESAVEFYNLGLEMAAEAETINVVKQAAYDLQTYLLRRPEMEVAAVYWPLNDDGGVQETAVLQLNNPDLYWRYRAEFGFRLITDLFKRQTGIEEQAAAIYDSIIADIERAYALNPEHQVWRDFFVDANVGWQYLRRGDEHFENGRYRLALADYSQASRLIQPDSENARGDLADATFKAGLAALAIGNSRGAHNWYEDGLTMVKTYGDLAGVLETAVENLTSFLDENPDLSEIGEPLLEELSGSR